MKYSAFISYNHRNRDWAIRLHRALESYSVPKRLRGRAAPWGELGPRLPPVFRDRDELAASADLDAAVRRALAESTTLVVICSPHAARSRWVDQEVRAFIDSGRRDRIRLVVVDGQPHAADPEQECLPPALRDGGPEPLAADVRKTADGRSGAILKLIAGIIDVPFDELRQREVARRQQRLLVLASAASIGFLIMAGLTVIALMSRAEALRQRTLAEQRMAVAERTVDFVKGMFSLADPSEAKGAAITAREIVDRAADRLENSLSDQPVVKAELAVALADVYGALGLYTKSDRLVRRSFTIPVSEPTTVARRTAALAESMLRLGDYEAAERQFRRALAQAPNATPSVRSRILAGLGQSLTQLERYPEATPHLRRALLLDRARGETAISDQARDYEALGLNQMLAGDLQNAKPLFVRALALRRKAEGNASPSVSDNYNSLGSIAYLQSDLDGAERFFRGNLVSDERVLGPDHPDTATTRNNLARVLLEKQRFAEAAPLLERAMRSNLVERGQTHDQMAFVFSNLAIVKARLGQRHEAERLFDEAIAAARSHSHRTLGPSLADLASLRCARGAYNNAFALLDEAATVTRADYPDDPWRSAWVDNIRGECLWLSGRKREGKRLVLASSGAVSDRWPTGTLFASENLRRRKLVGSSVD
ncbi:tetratricopeptide repeat protein [Sphingomonas sp. BN140010]|uniref:Tetratricopeptide repeat protein n=1 Tax=Sphingomonas arvum TaxID=2992113 RepID=A0ABT3JH95_9SPHN|nr:tetratricopeptide repeat protein [Sphingomonas sp. BN140010]MCW3798457.1 tetratricopeptide repeat protein [Sphingomonas sp. BN140010]